MHLGRQILPIDPPNRAQYDHANAYVAHDREDLRTDKPYFARGVDLFQVAGKRCNRRAVAVPCRMAGFTFIFLTAKLLSLTGQHSAA